ncbi:MAG TPA: LysM peptidoglycan-binding domain-containing protein, partial [Longimicrobium sp.]|nr:LysM peptidoglycan-binding domain-containing protein [Longimicrobium sp.]
APGQDKTEPANYYVGDGAVQVEEPEAVRGGAVPELHVVRRGDTLWDLARQYLADPFLWPDIFRLNTDVVSDPARIYPNERLVLPGTVAVGQREGEHTVFYNQGQRTTDLNTVLEASRAQYPVVRQGDFYAAGYVARDNEVAKVARLAEVVSATVVPLSRQPTIQVYDQVYLAADSGARLGIGDRVQLLRPGRVLEGFGRVWLPTGLATVSAVDGGTATAVVIRMFDQVRPGDVVVPVAAFPVPNNVRPAASTGLQGRIVAFQRAHPVQASEEIAFLDVGRQAGVKEGDVFEVFLPRTRRDWGTRPEIPVGRLQVVKVMNGTASARITHLDQPAIAVGQPVRRVAAMP